MTMNRVLRINCLLVVILSAKGFQSSSTKSSSFLNGHGRSNFGHVQIQGRAFSQQRRGRTNVPIFAQPPVLEVVKDSAAAAMNDSIEKDSNAQLLQQDESESESSTIPEYLPILGLLWFVALLSALDRVAMSVAILPLSTEYHLTDTAKGGISSIFSVGYGLGIIPCGLLVSAVSPRLIMASGVTLWSLATFGTPIAASLINVVQHADTMTNAEVTSSVVYIAENTAPLLFMRSVMGAAESVVLPTIQRMLANWVPASKKSLSVATVMSGFQTGTVCAYLLSPWVMENLGGWRGLFYVYGSVGALWIIPWWIFARDSPAVASLEKSGNAEKRLMNANEEGDAAAALLGNKEITAWEEAVTVFKDAPWKDMLASKATWGMTMAHAANNWGLYNTLSWTPTFYAEQYGLNVKESAFLSILPSVAGAVGGLFAGYAADKVLESFVDDDDDVEKITLVRKGFQALALLGPAACLFILASHIPEDPVTAQFLLTGTVGLQAFNAAGYSAAPQEKAGEKWAGLLYSITSLPGVVFGSIGVYVTGQILDITNQNWSGVYALNGAVDVIGALAFVALYNSRKEFE